MNNDLELPKLPAGYFFRITQLMDLGFTFVQIRRQRRFGSAYVLEVLVNEELHMKAEDALKAAANIAVEELAARQIRTENIRTLADYTGDYR